MKNETKEHIVNLISLFVSIIIAGSLFSGLGRFISGAKFYTGVLDGFFISLAIFISLNLSTIIFFKTANIPQYSLAISLIVGFLIGGIPGIISHYELTFFISGVCGGLLSFSFVFIEKYLNEKKEKDIIKILLLHLLPAALIGFLCGGIFNIFIEINLLSSINPKSIFMDALYGAIWGGLIILGIKLSILYLKPLIKVIIPPILSSIPYGLTIAVGTGIFGTIVETITYTSTNFDMTATGAKPLSQALTLSFLRDAGFGLYFGFIFTIIQKLIPIKKLENPLFIISGGLAGFLAPKILRRSFTFVLSPLDGAILGIGIGLGVFLSNIKEDEKRKKRIWTLILSPSFGFLALIISKFLEGASREKTFFYLLSFGILGAIYAGIIILALFICDYYLELTQKNISTNL